MPRVQPALGVGDQVELFAPCLRQDLVHPPGQMAGVFLHCGPAVLLSEVDRRAPLAQQLRDAAPVAQPLPVPESGAVDQQDGVAGGAVRPAHSAPPRLARASVPRAGRPWYNGCGVRFFLNSVMSSGHLAAVFTVGVNHGLSIGKRPRPVKRVLGSRYVLADNRSRAMAGGPSLMGQSTRGRLSRRRGPRFFPDGKRITAKKTPPVPDGTGGVSLWLASGRAGQAPGQ